MAILLKTAPVRVSSIQIMQVRVQKRAKVFGKVDTTETYHVCVGIFLNYYVTQQWHLSQVYA